MGWSGLCLSPRVVRRLLAAGLFALVVPAFCIAQTGTPVPALSSLDAVMQQALARYSVKGGAIAVVKDGRLVFARGYGWADFEGQLTVQPDSLFRWASVSKTLTAAGQQPLWEPVFQIDEGGADETARSERRPRVTSSDNTE